MTASGESGQEVTGHNIAMPNPWTRLAKNAPFVLPEDSPYVEAFNAGLRPTREAFRINTHYIPEPRLGPVTAPVVILQLNPSFDAANPQGRPDVTRQRLDWESLVDEDYPHLGVRAQDVWWTPRLRELELAVGGPDRLERGISSIEFFPYRSKSFSHSAIRIPSQAYTFELVRSAITRGAIFIVTRNLLLWRVSVPELREAPVFQLGNARSTYFTRANLSDEGFERVVAAIRG